MERGRCTQAPASFFGFGKKVYLLNGHEYMSWDGDVSKRFAVVEGYIPTVGTGQTPAGVGQTYENVNRLTGKRKVKLSPDGSAAVFFLGKRDIDEVNSVEGTAITYTVDKAAGSLAFASAPPIGVNSVVVACRKGTGSREDVERMRFCEFCNGAQDTRVFLYGDGTNRAIYNGYLSPWGVHGLNRWRCTPLHERHQFLPGGGPGGLGAVGDRFNIME